MVVSLALILSSSNLYGYIRCKLGGNFKSVLTQYVGKQIFYNVSYYSKTKHKTLLLIIEFNYSLCRLRIRKHLKI